MNKELKSALKSAFEAPLPPGKDAFLKELNYPTRNYHSFLFSQIFYIRKRVWFVSFLTILVEIVLLHINRNNKWSENFWGIWSISSMIPFFALFVVLEIYRSSAYHMAELEGTLRFSLAEIIVARLIILGTISIFVLFLLFIFVKQVFIVKAFILLLYVMVPYLLVCGLSLGILNHKNSTESTYGCVAIACFISLIGAMPFLYKATYLPNWFIAFIICILLMVSQIKNLLKQTEEQSWNLIFGK